MANRVMAAKRVKMVRMRRAWARQLNRKGGYTANREVIKGYAAHARGLEDEEFVDRIADELKVFQKKEALQKQARLEASLPEGVDMRVVGPSGQDQLQESWMYFNSQKTCFVLIHRDFTQGIERRSTTYSSKELLIMCWEGGRVAWVEKKPINSPVQPGTSLGEENESQQELPKPGWYIFKT